MDSVIEKQFHAYLITLGFPPESIIYEPAFKASFDGRKYRPDFAVLDPKTREPLAIIELKGMADQSLLQSALQQVRWYTNQLQNPSIRAYVATRSSGSGAFDFYQDDEAGNLKKVDSLFVEAASLTSASTAEKKEILAEKRKRTIDGFFVVCYVAAAVAFLIAIADFLLELRGITVLTTARIILLGSAAGFLIIPFLQKFKALGIEIERKSYKEEG
tara:strand:- start:1999 stop:2646 length:648 start_codon:yes stop_codon:yes gene_type:complete